MIDFANSYDTILANNPELRDVTTARKMFELLVRFAPDIAKEPTAAEAVVTTLVVQGTVDLPTIRLLVEIQRNIQINDAEPHRAAMRPLELAHRQNMIDHQAAKTDGASVGLRSIKRQVEAIVAKLNELEEAIPAPQENQNG